MFWNIGDVNSINGVSHGTLVVGKHITVVKHHRHLKNIRCGALCTVARRGSVKAWLQATQRCGGEIFQLDNKCHPRKHTK